jgi:hypothetical protein
MAYSVTIFLRLGGDGYVDKLIRIEWCDKHNKRVTWPWENLTREFYAEKLTRSAQPFALFFALFFTFLLLDL